MLDANILKNLLFLDTETTGREEGDRIFQVAYSLNDKEFTEMFKPPIPLCIEAMEATGYTNRDVEDKEAFRDSNTQKTLQELFEREELVFVAHNAQFDIEMLRRDDVFVGKFIDTLKVARFLDPEAKLGAYRLQYLRYALDLQVENAQAHDALGDVRVLKALFERLFNKMLIDEKEPGKVIEKMIEISSRPSFIHKITFGKHVGKFIKDIESEDRGYLEWLLRQKLNDSANSHDENEDWIYTLRTVLNVE